MSYHDRLADAVTDCLFFGCCQIDLMVTTGGFDGGSEVAGRLRSAAAAWVLVISRSISCSCKGWVEAPRLLHSGPGTAATGHSCHHMRVGAGSCCIPVGSGTLGLAHQFSAAFARSGHLRRMVAVRTLAGRVAVSVGFSDCSLDSCVCPSWSFVAGRCFCC